MANCTHCHAIWPMECPYEWGTLLINAGGGGRVGRDEVVVMRGDCEWWVCGVTTIGMRGRQTAHIATLSSRGNAHVSEGHGY